VTPQDHPFPALLLKVLSGDRTRKTLSEFYKAAEGLTLSHAGDPNALQWGALQDYCHIAAGKNLNNVSLGGSDRSNLHKIEQFLDGSRVELGRDGWVKSRLLLKKNRVLLWNEEGKVFEVDSVAAFCNNHLSEGDNYHAVKDPDAEGGEVDLDALRELKMLPLLQKLKECQGKLKYDEDLGEFLDDTINGVAILFHDHMKGYPWAQAFTADELWKATQENPLWREHLDRESESDKRDLFQKLLDQREAARAALLGAVEVHDEDCSVWDVWNDVDDYEHGDVVSFLRSPTAYLENPLSRALSARKANRSGISEVLHAFTVAHKPEVFSGFLDWCTEVVKTHELKALGGAWTEDFFSLCRGASELGRKADTLQFSDGLVHLKKGDASEWAGPVAQAKEAVLYTPGSDTEREIRVDLARGSLQKLHHYVAQMGWWISLEQVERLHLKTSWLKECQVLLEAATANNTEERDTRAFLLALLRQEEALKAKGCTMARWKNGVVVFYPTPSQSVALPAFVAGKLTAELGPEEMSLLGRMDLLPLLDELALRDVACTDAVANLLEDKLSRTALCLTAEAPKRCYEYTPVLVADLLPKTRAWKGWEALKEGKRSNYIGKVEEVLTRQEDLRARHVVAVGVVTDAAVRVWRPFGESYVTYEPVTNTAPLDWQDFYQRRPPLLDLANVQAGAKTAAELYANHRARSYSAQDLRALRVLLEEPYVTAAQKILGADPLWGVLQLKGWEPATDSTYKFLADGDVGIRAGGLTWAGPPSGLPGAVLFKFLSSTHYLCMKQAQRGQCNEILRQALSYWTYVHGEGTGLAWSWVQHLPWTRLTDAECPKEHLRALHFLRAIKARLPELQAMGAERVGETSRPPNSKVSIYTEEKFMMSLSMEDFCDLSKPLVKDAPLSGDFLNLLSELQDHNTVAARQKVLADEVAHRYPDVWFVLEGACHGTAYPVEKLQYTNYPNLISPLRANGHNAEWANRFTDLMIWVQEHELQNLKSHGIRAFRLLHTNSSVETRVEYRDGEGYHTVGWSEFHQMASRPKPGEIPESAHPLFKWLAEAHDTVDDPEWLLRLAKRPFHLDARHISRSACYRSRRALSEAGDACDNLDNALIYLGDKLQHLKDIGVLRASIHAEEIADACRYLFVRDDGTYAWESMERFRGLPSDFEADQLDWQDDAPFYLWLLLHQDKMPEEADIQAVFEHVKHPMRLDSEWLNRDNPTVYQARDLLTRRTLTDMLDDALLAVFARKAFLASRGVTHFQLHLDQDRTALAADEHRVTLVHQSGSTHTMTMPDFLDLPNAEDPEDHSLPFDPTSATASTEPTQDDARRDDMATPNNTAQNKLQQARQTITLELGDAGWRIAGKQTTFLFRDAVVALLKRTLDPTDQDASMTSRLVGFFESDLGMALLQGALGTALATVPELPNPAAKPYTDVAARLGKECRTEAIAVAGNTLVELVMGPLRQVVSGVVQGSQAPAFLPQEAEPLRQLTPPQGVPQAVFIEVKDAQAVPPKKDELLGQKSDG